MTKFFLSCEHGGNYVPPEFQYLFREEKNILQTHRAIDFGTLDLFNSVETNFDFAKSNNLSRLVIEFNRSLHHPKLFSKYTQSLSKKEKEELIQYHYQPYRNAFETAIQNCISKGEKVVHISLHSFTPQLNGETRNCDIGILYDPKRMPEKEFASALKQQLAPLKYKVRMNYPYKGTADGFTTYLRKKFPSNYVGIELEINQSFCDENCFSDRVKRDMKSIFESIWTGK